MTHQEIADRLAVLAKPRLATLFRLSTAQHVYDPNPGALNSQSGEAGVAITLDQWKRGVQPYKDLDRFVSEERVMQSIVDPGLLPIAKAVAHDVRGRKFLVTRRIAAKKSDQGVVAHVEGCGVRILIHVDSDTADTIVTWECLYGVA